MNQVFFRLFFSKSSLRIFQLSCFIRAVSDDTTNEELRLFLIQLLDSPDMATIGSEPFSVPRKFIDFR
jgi:hypothetical protein